MKFWCILFFMFFFSFVSATDTNMTPCSNVGGYLCTQETACELNNVRNNYYCPGSSQVCCSDITLNNFSCCERAVDGYYCEDTSNITQCNRSYMITHTSCSTTSFCKNKIHSCGGCIVNNSFGNHTCLLVGESSSNVYCDPDKLLKNIKSLNDACENNYECLSSYCKNNRCFNPESISEVSGFFERIWGWIKRIF